ncbi:guanylate kinase [candidate division WOR-1 bacterium RIFOXYC2_FULL_37_10]|uniref:Guanylate kinase n=1 Tax=candidate division WOR-1 bacterium RIFOXYB2_FULL_37_13 TaxID=1802579 RepID=A0A1F4SNJ2_UNCSA|nr:MAG: guanylate kinase [candidate division WOR-1 bacterium RIFOXYB2_FULL_37_13]OGC33050.1 MAG: guanylate kinase [candidate division WOR-1 bacterium RIFOXYC2_FULL_37_10]
MMPKRRKTRCGFLVVISGPSGVGKSTVVRRLLEVFPELKMSISATTRPPRPMEKNKLDYHFLTEKDFFEQVKNNSFLEWAQVHKYYYGTPIKYIEEEIEKNNIVVVEVDVQGASKIKEKININQLKCSAVFIFLIPPSVDILAFRLKRRKTEKVEAVNYRLRAAIAELQVMEKYDYIVVNDKVDSAAQKIRAIINVEKEKALLN